MVVSLRDLFERAPVLDKKMSLINSGLLSTLSTARLLEFLQRDPVDDPFKTRL